MQQMKYRFVEYGGSGTPLHFLHANGYPFYCYEPLLDLFAVNYHVFGMLLRPLWGWAKPEDISDWHVFSEDLLSVLKDYGTDPVIGVGHSIGAIVTLRAALREPGRFKALVLIDPVLFIPRRLVLWSIVRSFGFGSLLHPRISAALKRRRTFDNLEKVFRGYRNREIFRYMSDENLRTFIEGMTRPAPDGKFELVFSPEWEARIYFTGLQDFDIWRDLPKLEVPTLFIRGAESDTFLEAAARLVKQKQPRARIEALPKSTHLLSLEYPREVFDIMQSFLKEVL
ncbi:MAG TPA: alpha/beta hydrolase [Anaerolineales bacterium]|nr:alpha/beta hydrolase [Anaerolineales bacterium]